jgi:hypothetical protein
MPKQERAKLRDRIVWASTSNPYYSLDGVHVGEAITTASATLGTEAPLHIGLNHWYLAHKPGYRLCIRTALILHGCSGAPLPARSASAPAPVS